MGDFGLVLHIHFAPFHSLPPLPRRLHSITDMVRHVDEILTEVGPGESNKEERTIPSLGWWIARIGDFGFGEEGARQEEEGREEEERRKNEKHEVDPLSM